MIHKKTNGQTLICIEHIGNLEGHSKSAETGKAEDLAGFMLLMERRFH